jgi:hypothetical protein
MNVEEVSTYAGEDGDQHCEIFLRDRRVILFVEKGTSRMGWAIASRPPDLVRDGSGWIEQPTDLFAVLKRGFNA